MQSTCRLTWGVILREEEIEVVSCVFIIFDVCGSVRECICVTHTHTHAANGVLDVSPGVGTRHLEGPKNPDGLNLGKCVFVYVYTVVPMCICMLGSGMRCGLNAFFVEKKIL